MRATLIVLDSLGVGAMPDAHLWGDSGADTLGHMAQAVGAIRLPNMEAMGLGNIHQVPGVAPVRRPTAGFGRLATLSQGKDSVTGHWEMMGALVDSPFNVFLDGFPREVIEAFEAAAGAKVLGNKTASGTAIIEELGEEHMATGRPILYTSADSVFQIAAHEDVIPIPRLYALCEAAFQILQPWRVARVIARPFRGQPGGFWRTENRRDFALEPPHPTTLDLLLESGQDVWGIGKVASLFGERGFTSSRKAGGNDAVLDALLELLESGLPGFLFANLVDFDMKYGHRRDPVGYARALEAFDARLPQVMRQMGEHDLLVIAADHGNDPAHAGSDHTREYVPVLAWRPENMGPDLGTRRQLADLGATVADHLGVAAPVGSSFLRLLAPDKE